MDPYFLDDDSEDEEDEQLACLTSSDEDDGELCLQRVIGPVDSKQRCSGILRDNMSSCMLPAQQKPLNPPGPFCKGKNTGDEECEDEEFESVLNRELEATFHVIEADAGLKERKNRQESSNDDLFYDPHMDDADQKWIDKCRRKYLRKSQSSSKNGGNDEKSMKLPHSDAILNCPCCMSMLCLDCQRHELYSGQYRAMFVFNCIVDFDQTLLYPKKGTKKRKRGKECALGMQAALGDHGCSQGFTSDLNPKSLDELKDVCVNTVPRELGQDEFHAVKCKTCGTQVAVYDRDEVYHFFHVLASHS